MNDAGCNISTNACHLLKYMRNDHISTFCHKQIYKKTHRCVAVKLVALLLKLLCLCLDILTSIIQSGLYGVLGTVQYCGNILDTVTLQMEHKHTDSLFIRQGIDQLPHHILCLLHGTCHLRLCAHVFIFQIILKDIPFIIFILQIRKQDCLFLLKCIDRSICHDGTHPSRKCICILQTI